jgi:hypothetical protein
MSKRARDWKTSYMIDKNGCWIWQGQLNSNGYARLDNNGIKQPAHQVAYRELVGPIPVGMELDHKCRVRACVNPAHLEPVTHTQNMRRGSSTKLTPAQVLEIKRLMHVIPAYRLAIRFSVARTTISSIKHGYNWVKEI